MYHKGTKLLYTSLTLTLVMLTLVPFFQISVAQARPKIFVDPPENIFYTDTTSTGPEFDVSIKSADWSAPGVYGFQFRLYYDNTMLEAVSAGLPTGHWFTPTTGVPPGIFIVDPGTIHAEEGYVSFSATLTAPEEGRVGGGTIAVVTFRITADPPAVGKLSSLIYLGNVILPDPSAAEIPSDSYDRISSLFEFSGPPPPAYLKVEPSIVTANSVGDQVSINVMIHDAEEEQKIIGAEFKVLFDPSILSIMDVTEGDFFAAFGTFGTFFVNYADTDYGIVGILMLPTDEGTYPPDAELGFPRGSGSLANIKFEVISLPEVLTEFPLRLTDVKIVDADLNEVPPLRLEDAVLMAPTRLEDLNQDGSVNILDMTAFALAFGSIPGDLRWNSMADIDQNGIVNILDGVMVAKAFGS